MNWWLIIINEISFKLINMSKYFKAKSILKHKESLFYRVFDIWRCALTCSPMHEEKCEAHGIIEKSQRKSHLTVRSFFLPKKIALTENMSSTEICNMDILFWKISITPCGLPSNGCKDDLQRGSLSSECSKFPQSLLFCHWEINQKH